MMKKPSPYPSSKLVCIQSNFKDKKSPHVKTVQNHCFNQKMEIYVPNSSEEIESSLRKFNLENSSFYYKISNIELVEMLQPEFIDTYVRNGVLILSVDKATYEELGLVGKNSEAFLPRTSQTSYKQHTRRYTIEVNLLSKKFQSGEPFYDRVLECLSSPSYCKLRMITMYVNKEGIVSIIHFSTNVERIRVSTSSSIEEFSDIFVPQINEYGNWLDNEALKEINASESTKKRFTKDTFLKFYDWLGLVSNRLTCLLTDMTEPNEPFVSTFTPPQFFSSVLTRKSHVLSFDGLLNVNTCANAIEMAQTIVRKDYAPWCSVTVWGIPDSPTSWVQKGNKKTGMKPHGFLLEGNNSYTILCLKNEDYWIFKNIGPHDTTS